jgi:hypothetical protein
MSLTLIAKNFAVDSPNRIHRDDVARQYGFPGGLVPGVALFAYLTQPVVAAWGRDWLTRGAISARFLQPVLDGELVTVLAQSLATPEPTLSLELKRADQTLCAVASAQLPSLPPAAPTIDRYPHEPPRTSLLPANIHDLPPLPCQLASRDLIAQWQTPLEGPEPFVDALCDPSPLYRSPQSNCHPALIVAHANFLIMQNFDLGPWLHVASQVQYFAQPEEGALLSLRGAIVAASEKKGHHFIEADLALFDQHGRALARTRHTAIIRPTPRLDP